MKANELMIENYISYYGSVTRLVLDDFQKHGFDMPFKPIRLTEDWLKGFGFEKHGNTWLIGDLSEKGDISANDIEISLYEKEGNFYWSAFTKQIYHVHRLQNLYFSIHQKRLDFNGRYPSI